MQRLEERLSQVGTESSGEYAPSPTVKPSFWSSPEQTPASSSACLEPEPLFSSFSLCLLPESTVDMLQPSISRARELWQVYLTDIDPLFKIVDHQDVENTLLTYPNGPIEKLSLLRAVFFAAEASTQTGPIPEQLAHARALEVTLQCANVLSRPNVLTVQALTIYLVCGRLNMDQDYLRCMLALLVELAMKLKLNQNPEKLDFSNPDTESRCRLWDVVVALDVRTAEQCGTEPMISSRQMRTRTPSVVPNAVLSSTMPKTHDPRTFYAVVASEMAKAARQVLFSLDLDRVSAMVENTESRIALSEELHAAMFDKYIRQCSCTDSPICKMTLEWYNIYSARLKLLVKHERKVFLHQVSSEYTSDSGRDLAACLDILERIQILRAHPEYSRWAWLWRNPVEWDVCAIALCAIATDNCAPGLVKRAWMAIDSFFGLWAGDFGDPAHRRRWRTLQTFRDWVRATQLDKAAESVGDMDLDMSQAFDFVSCY